MVDLAGGDVAVCEEVVVVVTVTVVNASVFVKSVVDSLIGFVLPAVVVVEVVVFFGEV